MNVSFLARSTGQSFDSIAKTKNSCYDVYYRQQLPDIWGPSKFGGPWQLPSSPPPLLNPPLLRSYKRHAIHEHTFRAINSGASWRRFLISETDQTRRRPQYRNRIRVCTCYATAEGKDLRLGSKTRVRETHYRCSLRMKNSIIRLKYDTKCCRDIISVFLLYSRLFFAVEQISESR